MDVTIFEMIAKYDNILWITFSETCKAFNKHFHHTSLRYELAFRTFERTDKPEWAFRLNGVRHSTTGPAKRVFVFEDEIHETWYKNGIKHRIDGPAKIIANSQSRKIVCEKWYYKGELHRTDGPAIIKYMDTTNWLYKSIMPELDHSYIQINGIQRWYKKGLTHRTNGPAIIKPDSIQYYKKGFKHRIGGPAVIRKNAVQYYKNGVLHRTDGPAVIYDDHEEWWYHGQYVSRRAIMLHLSPIGSPRSFADETNARSTCGLALGICSAHSLV